MCCEQLQKGLRVGTFNNDDGLHIIFKSSDYDEDYGYAEFEHKMKIEYCPFCGTKQ